MLKRLLIIAALVLFAATWIRALQTASSAGSVDGKSKIVRAVDRRAVEIEPALISECRALRARQSRGG